MLICVSLAFFLAAFVLALDYLLSRALDASPRRPRGGSGRRPASRSTSPATTFTTGLAARIAAYSSSNTEHGRGLVVPAIPRTLDALSRRIAPGCSTAATGDPGVNGQRGPTAASPDPLSWPS